MKNSLPRIALTMGDPAGVGPELALKALAEMSLAGTCLPLIFGDASVLSETAAACGPAFVAPVFDGPAWLRGEIELPNVPAVLDWQAVGKHSIEPGRVSAVSGEAAYTYVERSIDAALAGRISAVTTGPLNKEALHAAGRRFPGHTEIFAARTHAPKSCMMQYSEEIVCTFVTVHVGYREVPELLTVRRILDVIELTDAALRKIRGKRPKIVVLGLNPHAGEHGLFGDREEERVIEPAIDLAREQGFDVEGPIPPDTAFFPRKRRETDAFVCMYHDQGHIPVKALAFDQAVNTTLGLPIVRTSVDHGTAFDIVRTGTVDPGSLFAALRLAALLSKTA